MTTTTTTTTITAPKSMTRALLVLDAILCAAILWRVNYTEIDWRAYMQQVQQVLAGERDYRLIKGDTGPLVYPAAHVYFYSLLYGLTDGGRLVPRAQVLFAGLYLATVAVTMSTYRRVKSPLYVFPLLILSKRLHSIYLLRLFNDGVSALLLSLATHSYVGKRYTFGSVFFSLALAVKMNALLYLPGIAMILLQGLGVFGGIRQLLLMLQLQVLLATPFLLHDPSAYLARAFEFSRTFEYQWTVNWRFLSEPTFLSSNFSILLIACHLLTLLLFAATRWARPSRRSLPQLILTSARTALGVLFPTGTDGPMADMTPSFILTTLYVSNLIGVLFARSAHYQFYTWFAFSIPYLLHKTDIPIVLQIGLWTIQELAWNVFPSTPTSSAIVVAVPAFILLGVWSSSAKEIVAFASLNESKTPGRSNGKEKSQRGRASKNMAHSKSS